MNQKEAKDVERSFIHSKQQEKKLTVSSQQGKKSKLEETLAYVKNVDVIIRTGQKNIANMKISLVISKKSSMPILYETCKNVMVSISKGVIIMKMKDLQAKFKCTFGGTVVRVTTVAHRKNAYQLFEDHEYIKQVKIKRFSHSNTDSKV